MEQLAFRNLVGVAYTEEEAKNFAEEYEYPADPDEEGNPTTRPGKLSDYFPNPYPNEEAAKFANNGEAPIINDSVKRCSATSIGVVMCGLSECHPPGSVSR